MASVELRNSFNFIIRKDRAQRYLKSAIRNPQSAIRNPRSAIRNPQSAIRDPQSAIRNPQSQIPNLPDKLIHSIQVHERQSVYLLPNAPLSNASFASPTTYSDPAIQMASAGELILMACLTAWTTSGTITLFTL